MKGDPVPDLHHVARLLRGTSVHEDGTVGGEAFRLRKRADDGWEGFLSVNWLEFLAPANRQAQIQALRAVLAAKLALSASARLAVLNVGEMRQYVREATSDRRDLQVLHEPEPGDSSHCGVYGLQPDQELIADLIAEVVREIHPARG